MDLSDRTAGEKTSCVSPRLPVDSSSSQISGEGVGEAVMVKVVQLDSGEAFPCRAFEPPGSGMQQVLSSARWVQSLAWAAPGPVGDSAPAGPGPLPWEDILQKFMG